MLQLVKHEEEPPTTYFQGQLFASSDPLSILLVSLPLKSGKDFVQVVEKTSPRLIVDLRDVPRFDFDFLSRSKIFEVFARAKSTYVDSELPSEPQKREDNWAELFTKHRLLVETKKGQPSGPHMFLFSQYDQLPVFEKFLQKELPKIKPKSWSIFYVATREEFAVHKFGK
jgi:hypothetical protein